MHVDQRGLLVCLHTTKTRMGLTLHHITQVPDEYTQVMACLRECTAVWQLWIGVGGSSWSTVNQVQVLINNQVVVCRSTHRHLVGRDQINAQGH